MLPKMSANMKYLATLVARPSPEFSEFMAAALATDDKGRAIEEMERALARGQSKVINHLARLRKLTQMVEKSIAEGETVDIGILIKTALQIEQHSAREQRACRKFAKQLAKRLRRDDPKFWPSVAPLIGRFDEVGADYLASLRDIRWDLMALEAEVNPSKKGPILRTPRDVRRHLDSLQA